MQVSTTHALATTPAALAQLGALALHYGFALVGAIILLIGGWLLSGILSRWAYKGLSRIHGFDETLARFFEGTLRYALLVLVFVMVLGQFGIQTASIVATLGAAGLAVGLALQGTLQNIAAGIMLLVLRPFRSGEYIETSNVKGRVREIGLFATELKTADGLYLMAPNSTLWNTPVTNHSREPDRRQELSVAVGNDLDIEMVKRAIIDIISSDPRVRSMPAPMVFSDDLTADKTTLKIEYWAASAEWSDIRHDVIDRLKAGLKEREIPIK